MTRTKRFAVWAAIAAASLAGLAACGSDDAGESRDKPIILGALYDGSGGASFYSEQSLIGIELAIEKINADGGILGRHVELVREDDENNATAAPLRTRSLVEAGAVGIFMTSGSASTLQAKAVLADEEVPGITPTNLNDAITKPPNAEYMFSTANSSGQVVEELIDYLDQFESIGIFTDTSPTGTALADGYRAAFEAAGIDVAVTEAVDVGATDASAQIARFRNAGVDAVFVSGQGAAEQALFVRQAHEHGLDIPMAQDTTAAVPQYWKLAGAQALENVVFTGQLDPANKKTEVVKKRFEAKHPDATFLPFHAQGWDDVYLFKEAIENADSTEGTAIKQALESISGYVAHWGSAGYKISCSAKSHLCATKEGIVLRGFENGEPGQPITE